MFFVLSVISAIACLLALDRNEYERGIAFGVATALLAIAGYLTERDDS